MPFDKEKYIVRCGKCVIGHKDGKAIGGVIAANKAARMGVLVKLPCRVCGDANVQAHHADYNKPLVVVWLCVKHHKELHRRFNNGEIKCL